MSTGPVGSTAMAAGYQIVPDDGEDGKVRHGAMEINRTRDYVAEVSNRVPAGKAAARTNAGITSGTAAPSGGANGDIYFQIVV